MDIIIGLCGCGCGERTKISPKKDALRGYIAGTPRQFRRGHSGRIATKYIVDEATGCWLWQCRCFPSGYAQLKHRGRTRRAHIVMYEAQYGAVPQGLQLDHLCRTRHCVNPQHLQPVSGAENSRRRRDLKLDINSASEIKALYATGSYSQRQLAQRFGVSQSHTSDILNGHRWSNRQSSRSPV